MAMPTPTPATNMVQPIWPMPTCGEMLALVRRIPTPASRQPVAIGMRGPQSRHPATGEQRRRHHAHGQGTKFEARPNGDFDPTTWRYSATMKKMAKVPK